MIIMEPYQNCNENIIAQEDEDEQQQKRTEQTIGANA